MKDYPQIVDIVQSWANDRKDDVELMSEFGDSSHTTKPDEVDSRDWCIKCLVENIISNWGCPGWHSECVAMICGVLGDSHVSSLEIESLKNAVELM